MMKNNKSFLSGMISGLLIAMVLLGGIYIGKQIYTINLLHQEEGTGKTEQDPVVNEDTMAKMQVIEDTISQNFLQNVDETIIQDGVYAGMVDALNDPYSTYYSQQELKEIQDKTEGIYYGIGAYVGTDEDTGLALISGIIAGTPAEAAGLRVGDLIYKVGDTMIQDMDTSEVVSMIKGEEGTKVHLTIVREGASDYLELDIERKKIESPTVNSEMKEGDIGYIQITEFDEVTTDQFAEALAVCKGSNMKGLVLDLRSNPGGNLNVVCDIARMILPEGMIVYTEDKEGKRNEYTSDGKNQIQVPMAVLVNGYSASASEILAGAIKDYGIGRLIGTTTFGKGIVQRIISLSDGSALKLTVSKYYTPKGNNIHKIGIKPDEEVKFDADAYYDNGVDNQLNAALEYLGKEIKK